MAFLPPRVGYHLLLLVVVVALPLAISLRADDDDVDNYVIGDDIPDLNPCAGRPYHEPTTEPKSRRSFSRRFIFGTTTASYPVEGATNVSGRGPSVWDRFTHKFPERIDDGSNGDSAIDMYHRFEEDIVRMRLMNMDAYRLSISWSRIIPSGKISEGVNKAGIEYYNKVLHLVKKHGMEAYVTIFHWSTPQALEAEYGGFLSRDIVADFQDYAEFLFITYGDLVKKWITLNEPYTYAVRGYDDGHFAPGRCSWWVNRACVTGDSSVEPYIVSHHLLLAHAAVVKLYREKYQIGITLSSFWFEPYSHEVQDIDAAGRAMDFMYGWFMDPLTYGYYPRSMTELVGSRLPNFTTEESHLLKGSFDFLGVNYYTSYYAKHNPNVDPHHARYLTDSHAEVTAWKNGEPIGPQVSRWLYIYPLGIRYLLNYTKDTYRNPTIYITGNGVSEEDDPSKTIDEALRDKTRIDYYHSHLQNVIMSMRHHNVTVRGFFAWSYADKFEWSDGYKTRFGLYYIDYKHNLKRYAKDSACWFTHFLKKPKTKAQKILRPKPDALPRALRIEY
ncbi:Beta-glucosidase 11 [Linum perenne]